MEPPKVQLEPSTILATAALTLPLNQVPFYRTTRGIIFFTIIIIAVLVSAVVIGEYLKAMVQSSTSSGFPVLTQSNS